MFMKLSFYYRTRDSTQNGVQVEKVTTILWPVLQQILYQKRACLGVKKKDSGDKSHKLGSDFWRLSL